MPRYYFDLHNDMEVVDEEGREFPGPDAAKADTIRSARELLAEDVMGGRIKLSHRIEVRDQAGVQLFAIHFRDVLSIDP